MADSFVRKYKPFKGTAEVVSSFRLLDDWFRVESAKVRFSNITGKEELIEPDHPLFTVERSDAVAGLIHDVTTGEVILIEQFRFPTLVKSGGWTLEVPAGRFYENEDPVMAIQREVFEEVGYKAHQPPTYIASFYTSPGMSSERVYLYYMPVTPKDVVSKGGGLKEENEYILRHNLDIDEAFALLDEGSIADAKTIIALSWLKNQILTGKVQKIQEAKKEDEKMPARISTQTMEMVIARNTPTLTLMEKVFSDLELLQVGANRTHHIWSKTAAPFTAAQDPENFLNNMPGLIASFKAVEDHLMADGAFTPTAAEPLIPLTLSEIIMFKFPTEDEIRQDPNKLADLVKNNPRLRVRIELANATWATRATSRQKEDGTRFKWLGRVNSLINLISPDLAPSETETDRFNRHMLVVKDQDQITVGAQWWMNILNDQEALAEELLALRKLIAETPAPATAETAAK